MYHFLNNFRLFNNHRNFDTFNIDLHKGLVKIQLDCPRRKESFFCNHGSFIKNLGGVDWIPLGAIKIRYLCL